MKYFVTFLILVSLISCNDFKTLKDARQIKVGMSTKDLEYVMGEPWTIDVDNNEEVWYFSYYSSSYRRNMIVHVKNKRVKNFTTY